VLMILNLSPRELGGARVNRRKVFGAYLVAATGILLMIRLSTRWFPEAPEVDSLFGSIENVGWVLFTEYLLPFEMVSVLLLAAIIGAVVLTRKSKGDGS